MQSESAPVVIIRPSRWRALALVCLVTTLACTQRVVVRAEAGVDEVWVAGERAESLGDGSFEAGVGPGVDDVPFEIHRKSQIVHGTIPRTEVSATWVAGSVAAAVCCVPTLAGAGFCLANPVMLLSVVGACATVNPSLCLSISSLTATWWTLPLVVSGTLCGSSPLLLNLWASQVPESVDLSMASSDATVATAKRQTQQRDVPCGADACTSHPHSARSGKPTRVTLSQETLLW